MPTIEENLYSAFSGSTLITGYTSTRVYPIDVPQAVTFPYVVYYRTGANPVNTFNGRSTDLENALVTVEAFSTSYATSKTLRQNILTVLDASTIISGTFQGESDSYEPGLNTDKKIYGIIMDFSFWGTP